MVVYNKDNQYAKCRHVYHSGYKRHECIQKSISTKIREVYMNKARIQIWILSFRLPENQSIFEESFSLLLSSYLPRIDKNTLRLLIRNHRNVSNSLQATVAH